MELEVRNMMRERQLTGGGESEEVLHTRSNDSIKE